MAESRGTKIRSKKKKVGGGGGGGGGGGEKALMKNRTKPVSYENTLQHSP